VKVDVDSLADIIIYLAELSLTNLKTNEGARNRHPPNETFENSCELQSADIANHVVQLRQLENEYGSDRGSNGQKRLREARDEVDLVRHVHTPLIESIEQWLDCTARQCTTNGEPDGLLSKS
jgi:hypothetical protein